MQHHPIIRSCKNTSFFFIYSFLYRKCSFDLCKHTNTQTFFFFIWPSLQSREYSFSFQTCTNLITWALRCLKPHWTKSPCLKTPSERFSTLSKSDWLIAMEPWNLISWIPTCLKPHGTISPCLKTPSERFSTLSKSDWLIAVERRNLICWIPTCLKPYWLNSPSLKTWSGVSYMVKTQVMFFWPLTPTQTHK